MESIEMDKKYLLDSNVLYALYLDDDRLHDKAIEKLEKLSKRKAKVLFHPLY